MKITYIKLENFIGIYNGTGKYKIEIDFNKVKSLNNIILLQGKNGSGKTTLMSTLHPFAGTLDDRSEIILPNTDGYKEIHIEHNENIYIIKHHYLNKRKRMQTKSFISCNDVELNENGTVKSFEEIVERELDVNPAFFVLARIGSNVKNFIGFKPAERKNYISKFLPDISQYLFEYKKINDKYLFLNKKIKSVTSEINKLDNEENLDASMKYISKQLKISLTNSEKIMEKINKNKGILSTLDIDKIDNDYEIAQNKVSKTTKNIEQLNELFTENLEYLKLDGMDFSNESKEELEKILTSSKEKLKNLDLEINVCDNEIKNKATKLEECKSNLSKLEKELKSYKLEKDLDEFKSMYDEYSEKLKDIENEKEKFDERYKLDLDDEKINYIIHFLNSIQENKIYSTRLEIVNEFKEKYDNYDKNHNEELILECNKKIKQFKDNINKLKKETAIYESKLNLKDILDDRPYDCKNDECPFISEALKYKDAADLIKENNANLEYFDALLDEEYDNLDFLLDLDSYITEFENSFVDITLFPFYEKIKQLIPNYFDSKEKYKDFITLDKNFLIGEYQKALDYSHLYMDEIETNKTLKEIKHNIEVLEGKDLLIKKTESLIKENSIYINKNKPLIERLRDELSNKMNLQDDLEIEIETLEESIKAIDTCEKNILINEKYQNILNNVSDDKLKIDNLNKENKQLMNDYKDEKENSDSLNIELDDIKYNLKRLRDFKKDLEYLNERCTNVEYLRKALSPTTGIPLLFVDVYLKKTKSIANKLLDVAYNGQFYIKDFILSETDFYIEVIKEDGVPVKDVTLTSQGEMSLIGLAISLAIIQQSNKKYNILSIDEMDKELDETNRRAFVDILDKQLEILNVEQCFLISHNKEFDNSNLDLILFEGHGVDTHSKEFMNGKNILFED